MYLYTASFLILCLCNKAYSKLALPLILNKHSTADTSRIESPDTAQSNSNLQFSPGQFTKRLQNDTSCNTFGEQQWTGTIDVTEDRRLFYWFFDSRNDPVNDPIIIWLNGGPGSSSMFGLFNEVGPCLLQQDSRNTTANPWAWNNNASLLFLDQPAGVGFSEIGPQATLPRTDLDGAQDFQTFLNVFFSSIFPDRARLPIHLAAESYGGHYGPVYMKYILDSQRTNSSTAFKGDIQSMILLNALVDFGAPSLGQYQLFCADDAIGKGILSDAACSAIADAFPTSMSLREQCNLNSTSKSCTDAANYCLENIDKHYRTLVSAGERNSYDIRIKCPTGTINCDAPNQPNITTYLNEPKLLAALGFPITFKFSELNVAMNGAYQFFRSMYMPTVSQIAYLLDNKATSTNKSLRLLLINGREDYIVNTPGNIIAYDDMQWSGQAEYRSVPWQPLPDDIDGATGFWKGTRDSRLVFVAVDAAGHMVPKDVRTGSFQILQKWISNGWKS